MRRKTVWFLLVLGLLAGPAYATYLWANTEAALPAFERDQFIEVQVVSAPFRWVADGREYSEEEFRQLVGKLGEVPPYSNYREQEVQILSTRVLRVSSRGREQEFQGSAGGIEMVGSWAGSRVREDKQPGVTLDDFRFQFPTTFWATESPLTGFQWLSFSPGRTTFGGDFSTVATIAYRGEEEPTCFVRARWLPEAPETTVVKLYQREMGVE